jgi:hypothetical protein
MATEDRSNTTPLPALIKITVRQQLEVALNADVSVALVRSVLKTGDATSSRARRRAGVELQRRGLLAPLLKALAERSP